MSLWSVYLLAHEMTKGGCVSVHRTPWTCLDSGEGPQDCMQGQSGSKAKQGWEEKRGGLWVQAGLP